ncbi:hypothetical protein F5884DRAFT_488224 [Xylogone sp. PMI_703]|nr:hypothetical protein F5884DRAFT_488224 [Xylogone sp. PMI_703]
MASSTFPSNSIEKAVANALPTDIEQFKMQWENHLKLQERGLIVYYIPKRMGQEMGNEALKQCARNLCALTENDAYLHYDLRKSAYRIGFFDPSPEAGQDIFIFEAKHCGLSQSQLRTDKGLTNTTEQSTNSEFSRDHDILTPYPQKVDRTVSKPTRIPKPRNMWIIYRQDKHELVQAQNPGMHASKISTIISKMWQAESPDIKEHYKKLAEEEKSRHHQQYPTYKCSPRKSSDIKRRKQFSKLLQPSILTLPNEMASSESPGGLNESDHMNNSVIVSPECKRFDDLQMPTSNPYFLGDDAEDNADDGYQW